MLTIGMGVQLWMEGVATYVRHRSKCSSAALECRCKPYQKLFLRRIPTAIYHTLVVIVILAWIGKLTDNIC